MPLSLDDILARAGKDPVIKNTVESILNRPLQTQQDVVNTKSPENVPFYLQANPEDQQQIPNDNNSVPVDLRENPSREPQSEAPPVVAANTDDDVDSKAPTKVIIKPKDSDSDEEDDSDDDKSKPSQHPPLNFGDAESNKSNLADALEAQKQALNDARIQRGFEQLGAGISRTNPNYSLSSDLEKNANLPVQQAEALQKDQLNDPNSGISKGLRDYMQKYGLKVSDGTTAAQIQQVAPYAFKDYEAKQAQVAKSQDLAERLAERKEESEFRNKTLQLQKQQLQQQKEQSRQDKLDKQDTDRFDKLNKAITSEVASSRSAFGQAARNAQAVDNAQALLSGEVDPNDLDTRQVYELSKVLDRVLSQGGTTIAGTEHLTPDTARAHLASQMEFFTNKRQGAQSGDFVNTMAKTLAREGDQARKQIASTQKSLLSSYSDLAQRHPEMYNTILREHGIPVMGEEPTGAAGSHSSSEYTPDVIKYAQANGLTNDQALAIKKKRMGQ